MEEVGIIYAAGVVVFGVLLIIGILLKGERFTMYQEATGKTIEVKRGFSFTYFFFGPFVPLFRGHIGGFFLSLFIELFTCGLARLILLFCYNGMYINWLAKNGFKRTGLENTGRQANGAVNIQINADSGQAIVSPAAPVQAPLAGPAGPSGAAGPSGPTAEGLASKGKAAANKLLSVLKKPEAPKERFQDADSVLQPVNKNFEDDGDEGATLALTDGTLVGVGGMYQGAELPIGPGDKIIIGRDGERSNLIIQDKEISRKHCEITYDAYSQAYMVCDYSTNGVYLGDGSRVAAQQPVYLQPGSTIRIGNTANIFQLK